MATRTVLSNARILEVNRSDLRQHQSKWLKKARGKNILLVKSNDAEEEKIVLDRQYFEAIRKRLEGLVETLEIAMDQRLFNQILVAADTLEDDLRLGKLHSLEDALAEN
jgi:hypothetical protein